MSEEKVKKLMTAMNVDVDNLCTFMAQDKVGDFTTQTNVGMLQKTLQCIEALDEDQNPLGRTLYEVQLELNDIELNKKAKAREVDAKREAYENVTIQLEQMRAEVERMQRRDAVKKLAVKYDIKLAVVRSTELKERFVELQKAVDRAQKDLQTAQDKILPLEERERKLRRDLEMKEKEFNKATKAIDEMDIRVLKAKASIRDNQENLGGVTEQLTEMVKSRKDLEKKKQQLDDEKRKVVETIKKAEPLVKSAKEKLMSVEPKRAGLRAEKDTMDDKVMALKQEQRQIDNEGRRIQNELNQNSDPREIYWDMLSGCNDMGDEANCMKWVQKNEDKFEKDVIGPLGLFIAVKHPEAQLLVNQSINRGLMNSYIVQTENDLKTFRSIPSQRKGAKKNSARVSLIKAIDVADWDRIGGGYSKETLDVFKQFGFQGFLKDYIECRDEVKTLLLAQNRAGLEHLYVRATSLNAVTQEHMKLVCPGTGQGPFRASMFIIDKAKPKDRHGRPEAYQMNMSFSQWNKSQGMTSSNRPVDFFQNFLGGSLEEDDAENVEQLKSKRDALQKEHREIQKRIADISKQSTAKDKEITELSREKADYKKVIEAPEVNRRKLDKINKALKAIIAKLSVGEKQDRAKLEREYMAAINETLNKMDVIAEHSRTAVNLHSDVVIEQETKQIYEDELRNAGDALDEAKRGLEDFKAIKQAAAEVQSKKKKEMDEALEELKTIQGTFDSAKAFVEYYKKEVNVDNACPENTVAEIQLRIEELEAQITNIAENAGVVEKYEAKAKEEKVLREALDGLVSELENSAAKVEDQSRSWMKQVQSIIRRVNDKFSEYMGKLQFAGEVTFLHKGTFAQYELQLHVAFKENQSVQVLDGHKHSGGERAVSTIMYLMALQNLISAPFRSVDEINQGMDERNERLVFDRIVSSCTGNSVDSQYFLVSPKLLQGLRSMEHADVTVLMIWNGPGVRSKWQISQMISQIKKRKRMALADIGNNEEDSESGFLEDADAVPSKGSRR